MEPDDKWVGLVRSFERIVMQVLILLLRAMVALCIFELGWLLLRGLLRAQSPMVLDVEQMFELFGFFLIVLVGVELISTLKGYLRAGVIHVEVVLEVALIAVAQKVIVLDTKRAEGMGFGLAALILALAVAFWCVRSKALRAPPRP